MGLAANQEIPNKPVPQEPWTFRRLFPFGGAISTLSKVFTSPLEILLGFAILILGLVALFGRPTPILFYILTFILLLCVIFERVGKPKIQPLKEKTKK